MNNQVNQHQNYDSSQLSNNNSSGGEKVYQPISPEIYKNEDLQTRNGLGSDQFPNQSFQRSSIGNRVLSKKIFIFGLILLTILSVLVVFLLKFKSRNMSKFFGKRGEIVWWGLNEEEQVVAPLIREFEEKNPSIKVVYQKQSPKDYKLRLVNFLNSEKGPDIFELHNSWVPVFKNQLSVLPSQIMGTDEYSKIFYPVIVQDMTTSKGVVGIPLFYDSLTLFVNQDIFSSSLSTFPKTWNDFSELVDPVGGKLTLKDKGGKIIQAGAALGITENVDFWQDILALIIIQNGADLENLNSDRVYDVINFYNLFSQRDKGVWDRTLPPSTVAFAQGKLAMYFGPSRKAYDILKLNNNLRFKTHPLPQMPRNTPDDPNYSYANYWSQGVWEKSANRELAWKFLKFLTEEASLEKLNQMRKKIKGFEMVSPRMSMNQKYLQDPILGSVAALAFDAKSWYLAGETFDDELGINNQVSKVFEKAVSSKERQAFEVLNQELSTILSRYELKKKRPPVSF